MVIESRTPVGALYVSPGAAPASVISVLRSSGNAVVPGFDNGPARSGLIDEHRHIIAGARGGNAPRSRNALRCLERKWRSTDYPAIHSAFYTDWARAVVAGYFDFRCAFNEIVCCTHECEPLKEITAPHFDTVQSLKFFVYLTDTSERNGAFRYAPGTHIANAAEALRWRSGGGRIVDTPNVACPEEAAGLLPFEGTAGTLLIFDTNGFHAGGTMQAEQERRVIRVQSYPLPRLYAVPPRFSLQWFRDTPWNPLNMLRTRPVPTRDATGGTFRVLRSRKS